MNIIKKTESVCPNCIKKIPARVIAEKNNVYLIKKCPKHGLFKVLLSKSKWYYTQLYDLYNCLNKKDTNQPPKVYNLIITMDCNLKCPICCVSAPKKAEMFSLNEIKQLLKNFKNTQLCLFGGEPTTHPQLAQIIKAVKDSGNIPVLYTNGVKISDINYLKELKKSGLNDVRIQFDGFRDKIYKRLRGTNLLNYKMKALHNLKELDIPTGLEVTVTRGVNEDQMIPILGYALEHDFVKAIAFFPYRVLGKAKLHKKSLNIDSLIEIFKKDTSELISLKKVMNFQKVVYILNKILSRKDCFSNNYFIIARKNRKAFSLDLNLNRLRISPNDSKLKLVLKMIPFLLKKNPIKFFWATKYDLLPMILSNNISPKNIKKHLLIIGFKDPCDLYTFDYQNARCCPGGNISKKRGTVRSSAEDNILREKEDLKINS